MKILWLSNTPCGASEKLLGRHYTKGGWLSALETLLAANTDIKLYVAFYWVKPLKPFVYKNTNYIPVLRDGSGTIVGRLLNKFFNIGKDEKEIESLLTVIDEVKPDIIHIHGTEDNYGLIQSFVDIPVVVSIQGILSAIEQKYFSGIPYAVVQKFEGIMPKLMASSVKRLYRGVKRNAIRERKILSLSSNIIGRTGWDKGITRILSPKSKYFVIQEMMRSEFYEKQWSKVEYGKTITIVSTLGPGFYKGLETIVRTAGILKQNGDVDFKWVLPGIDESCQVAKLVKRWLGIDYEALNIKMLGPRSAPELIDLMVNSDLYIQTSHIENSPNSLCEAMLLGLPCIASFAGGTDSLLKNGYEGLLVQDGDAYSLAGAVFKLYNDFEIAASYGFNARNRALLRHDKNKILHTIINIYKQVISDTL